MSTLRDALLDGAVVARRNLIKIKRVPEVLVVVLISPIMFVLLFAYVFGGSIQIPGLEAGYREFLIGGIFAQTVVGRTTSDVVYNLLSLLIMSLTGLLVGWRIRTSLTDAIVGYLLLLLFAYAVSWIMAFIGLLVPKPEVVNNASFIVIFPLTFVANTFVQPENLPGPLEAFANWNPVSSVTLAARQQFGNVIPGAPTPEVWSLQHPVAYTLLWVVLIVAIFLPLSVRQYQRSAAR